MDPYNLIPQTNLTVSTTATSNTITLTGLGGPTNLTLSVANVSDYTGYDLIVNSTPVGGVSTVVNDGDTLAVQVPLSASYSDVKHAILDFENFKQVAFTTVTESDPSEQGYIQSGKLFYEFPAPYTPSTPDNEILVIDTSNNNVTTVPMVDAGSPTGFDDGNDYIFAADYYGNKVQRIHPDTGQIVHTINVTGPYAVHFAPLNIIGAANHHTLIACPDTNTVYVYDGNAHTLMHTVSVGNRPVDIHGGITSDENELCFWVACFDDNTVEYYVKTGATAPVLTETFTLPANSGPNRLAVHEATGDCFVSMIKTLQIARCDISAVSTIVNVNNLQSEPWDLAVYDGRYLRVIEPKLSKGHASWPAQSLGMIEFINMDSFSSSSNFFAIGSNTDQGEFNHDVSQMEIVHVGSTKQYWGTRFITGEIIKHDSPDTAIYMANGVYVAGGQKYPFGITSSTDGSKVYVMNLYNDAPDIYGNPKRDPDSFDLVDVADQSVNTEITSNAVVMTGLSEASSVSIPNIYNAALIVNGSPAGTSTTVNNGDSLAIRLTTGDAQGEIYSIPIVFDTLAEVWEIENSTGRLQRIRGYIQGG